jgi:hypothetical protein
VPQLLTCPNSHHWDQTGDPAVVLPITHGVCPVCGEPPVAGSPIDWEGHAWEGIAVAVVLMGALAAALIAQPLTETPPVALLAFIATAVALAGVADWLLLRRRRTGLAAVARVLGFVYLPTASRARRAGLVMPPFLRKGPHARAWNWMAGPYRGTGVILLDGSFSVSSPPKQGYSLQTVVVFPDPVPGLPDFEFGPARDQRPFWNRNLAQLLGLRPTDPFLGEPFGGHYGFTGDAEAVRPGVVPALRDFLTLQPGWVLGAWQRRFYLYRPGRRCSPGAYPTLIAVAWRLREMLRSQGAPVGSP